MADAIELSVCIAHHRTPDLLRACLRAVADTTRAWPVEVLVVDNAPAEPIDALVADPARTTVLRNRSPRGFAANQNALFARARGRYWLALNSDTVVAPGALRELVAFMDAHPRTGLAGPKLVDAAGRVQPSCRDFPTPGTHFLEASGLWRLARGRRWIGRRYALSGAHDAARTVDWLTGACLIVRPAAVAAAGPYDAALFPVPYGEDLDWCWRMRAHGWEVRFDPDAVVMHHGGASPMAERALATYRGFYRFCARHHPRRRCAAIRAATVLAVLPRWLLARDDRARAQAAALLALPMPARAAIAGATAGAADPDDDPAAPDLSVIVLTHDTCDATRACLRAVLADAARARAVVETILVDNGSHDGTAARVREELPTVAVLASPTNLGFARGNNLGLAAARGRYLMVLNSDTEVRAGALDALVAFMDDHPEAGACGPALLNPDGSLQPSGRALPSVWRVLVDMTRLHRLWTRDPYRQPGRDYGRVRRVGEVSGAALVVRRAAYAAAGGLDPEFFAYYEDVDWCKRLQDAGYLVYYVPAAGVMHRWGETSRALPELAYRAGQHGLRRYFAKHHGRVARAAIHGMLAAKELVRLAGALVRRDAAACRFHGAMLASLARSERAARPQAGAVPD